MLFYAKNKEVQHAHTRFIMDDWPGVADDYWLLGDLVDCGCFYRHPSNQYDLQSRQRRRREKKVIEMIALILFLMLGLALNMSVAYWVLLGLCAVYKIAQLSIKLYDVWKHG